MLNYIIFNPNQKNKKKKKKRKEKRIHKLIPHFFFFITFHLFYFENFIKTKITLTEVFFFFFSFPYA